jgi:Mg/Co/Ni transporter MgtE
MILTAFGRDPQSSSIILTTVMDVVEFFSNSRIATMLASSRPT